MSADDIFPADVALESISGQEIANVVTDLSSKKISRLVHRQDPVPDDIKRAALKKAVQSGVYKYFEKKVLPDLNPFTVYDALSKLHRVIEQDTEIADKLLIKNHFAFTGAKYNEENLFQQKLPDQLWENIRTFIDSLRELPIWKDRSMAATVFGGKNNYDFWDMVFENGRTPDGTQVMTCWTT